MHTHTLTQPRCRSGPLRESIAADVADDRAEEDEDKDMILGEHMVNPFTGVSRIYVPLIPLMFH